MKKGPGFYGKAQRREKGKRFKRSEVKERFKRFENNERQRGLKKGPDFMGRLRGEKGARGQHI